MRISDWSSDVCSSDLGGHPGRRAGGGDQRPAFARGGVTILVRTKTQRREGISKSVRAELVEAPFFLTSLKKRRADRKSVVLGKSVSVRVDLGGRRIIKKKRNKDTHNNEHNTLIKTK